MGHMTNDRFEQEVKTQAWVQDACRANPHGGTVLVAGLVAALCHGAARACDAGTGQIPRRLDAVSPPVARPKGRWARRGGIRALWLLGVFLALAIQPAVAQPAVCDAGTLHFEPVGAHAWVLPAALGDAAPANQGLVSNLLLVREAQRVWLVGSGPTPALGAQVACAAEAAAGKRVTDLINAWPRPEAVLGNRAFAKTRLWAHRDVAAAMARMCPHCLPRLRERLGTTDAPLDNADIVLPTRHVRGDQGQLGPWRWRRLWRAPEVPVTLWALPYERLAFVPGLWWGGAVPDLRDAQLARMLRNAQVLLAESRAHPSWQWLGEQGGLATAQEFQAGLTYWAALDEQVRQAQRAGAWELDMPAAPADVPAMHWQGERHQMNWQRAWRELEAQSWAPAPARTPSPAASGR